MAQQIRKWTVELAEEQRAELKKIVRSQKSSALLVKRAHILLLTDVNHQEGLRTDKQIAERLGMTIRQVQRVRVKFKQQGIECTLKRKIRSDSGISKVFEGEAEAKLVSLCCSKPPKGQQRWTLQLLVDELCRLQIVANVCPETVRRTLKKTA